MAPTLPFDRLVRQRGRKQADNPQSWAAACPSCGGTDKLRAYDYDDGTATVSCITGRCTPATIAAAVGLAAGDTWADQWDANAFMIATHPPGDEPTLSAPLSSWGAVDMAAALADDSAPEETTILRRSDGVALFYPGRLHWLQGESESGKSWVALLAAKEVIEAGQRVLFLDFESDATTVGRRLLALGVNRAALIRLLTYVRPAEAPEDGKTSGGDFEALCSQRFALAIIDGTTDALMLFKYDQNRSDEVAAYVRRVPRKIADGTGAAVVQIDHVVKSADGRGRFAIGSQHKMAALDGVAYVVEPKEPLAPGKRGTIVLRVAKDRPGFVRARSGAYRAGDRTQEAARIVLDSTAPGVTVGTVEVPETFDSETGEAKPFKPTALMERVSRHLEATPGQSRRVLREAGLGRTALVADAVARLIEDGFVAEHPRAGRGGGTALVSVRPFREVELVPNRFPTGSGNQFQTPEQVVLVPPPKGGTGNQFGNTEPEPEAHEKEIAPSLALLCPDDSTPARTPNEVWEHIGRLRTT